MARARPVLWCWVVALGALFGLPLVIAGTLGAVALVIEAQV